MAITPILPILTENDIDVYDFMIYLDLFGGKLENCTEELKLPSDVEENRATPGKATSVCRAFVRRKLA